MTLPRKALLSDADRQTALSVIDDWKKIAEQKGVEATGAYLQLKAMTEARDLCKAQTTDVGDRLTALLGWLRDNHPRIYAKAPR